MLNTAQRRDRGGDAKQMSKRSRTYLQFDLAGRAGVYQEKAGKRTRGGAGEDEAG